MRQKSVRTEKLCSCTAKILCNHVSYFMHKQHEQSHKTMNLAFKRPSFAVKNLLRKVHYRDGLLFLISSWGGAGISLSLFSKELFLFYFRDFPNFRAHSEINLFGRFWQAFPDRLRLAMILILINNLITKSHCKKFEARDFRSVSLLVFY